jgi:multicomponent Na+:H+ antiporter subunit D
MREPEPAGAAHGEAPWPAVLALAITALLTIAFFFFNGATIQLERQVVENLL